MSTVFILPPVPPILRMPPASKPAQVLISSIIRRIYRFLSSFTVALVFTLRDDLLKLDHLAGAHSWITIHFSQQLPIT